MQTITPFLWFDTQAENAAKFYVSIFPNSKMGAVSYYPEGTPGPAGKVMTVAFTINGQDFSALNGGPAFTFNESISFMVNCDTQEEVDTIWDKLSAVPESEQCGWLKDKFGVSWQIIPAEMGKIMSGKDAKKVSAAMQAMMKMKKIDAKVLREAYDKA